MVAAAEEHVRARDVERRRDDDDRVPAALAREPRDRSRLTRVLNGTAVKHTTRAPAYRCVAQSRSACGQCFVRCTVESASTGATPRRMSASAGGRRRLLPESTTTTSAWAGADDSAGGQTKRTRQATSQAATQAGDDEQNAAQHGATVPSPPVSGVLFTCAGQRVDIVTAFKRAGARTVAIDVNRLAPALYHADAHAFVPRVDDPQYVPTLRALVHEHDIALDRAAHRPRPRRALAREGRARRARAAARAGDRRRARRQVARASALRGARHRLAAHVAAATTCRPTSSSRCS